MRRRLTSSIGPFGSLVSDVEVRVGDVNGPRGGVDKACTIKVTLTGLPSVVVEQRDASLRNAMEAALSRTEHAVRRAMQRRTARAR